MYPASFLQVKNFPTCTLGVVAKFDPTTKYSDQEKIVNEDGVLACINGVDLMTEVDVEVNMYPNQNVPLPLTNIAFNFAGSTMNVGSNTFLITDDVKIIGNAGHITKVGFKMMTNSKLP